MGTIMHYICIPFGWLMQLSMTVVGNYALAIVFFTLLTKIILMPVSLWVHVNSIKMVKIQPSINYATAEFYGDKERIAEEQTKLYKKAGYNPFASVIPLILQIILLMCVVYIIKEPLTYVLKIPDDICMELAKACGVADFREDQLAIMDIIAQGKVATGSLSSEALVAIDSIKNFDLTFLGLSLNVIPSEVMGVYILVPVVAGISSFLMCLAQNALNVLQKEQSMLNKYGVSIISVGISLILGFFVYTGVALYWVCSNVLAVVVQVVLNLIINPWKKVDKEELEKSRQKLAELKALAKSDTENKDDKKREKADYKRFFSIVNKHIVFYSEKSGFFKYFEALINGITSKSNVTIHYITNDPNDKIFELAKTNKQIQPYYIGINKLIPLMMKMDADIVVMTTPDLDNLFLKRSLVRKDIEYIYVPHDAMSAHMGFREGAFDNFDTFFAAGPHLYTEIRAMEKMYNTKEKTIVEFGYPYMKKLADAYEKMDKVKHEKPEILIAPSWQEDNLLDSCIDNLLTSLCDGKYHVIVRPHPEYVKRYNEKMQSLINKYSDIDESILTFETDFSKDSSIYQSDLLITDWSGIAYEYSFATKKPVLFFNTKLKMLNTNWEKLGLTPVEISLRSKVGINLEKDDKDGIAPSVEKLLSSQEEYRQAILTCLDETIYDFENSGAKGVQYILNSLVSKSKKAKENN